MKTFDPRLQVDLKKSDLVPVLLCFTIPLLLYLHTLLPGLGITGDSMRFQSVGKVLGISHPPGAPLYVMVTWLVSQIPVGELAWRINLFSALCGAASVALLYLITVRLTGGRIAGVAVAALMALARVFWLHSLFAEIYTFAVLLQLASVYYLFRWENSDELRHFAVSVLLLGLSFGVHQMSVFLLPGYAVFVFRERARLLRFVGGWLALLGGVLAGAATYLYILIRLLNNPVFLEHQFTVDGFLHYIFGGRFRQRLFEMPLGKVLSDTLPEVAREFVLNLGWLAAVMGLIGLIVLLLRRRRCGILLLSTAFFSFIFSICYNVADPESFMIPAFVSISIGFGVFLASALEWSSRFRRSKLSRAVVAAGILLAVGFEHLPMWQRDSLQLDLSRNRAWSSVSERIINAVKPGSLLVTRNKRLFLALFHQLIVVEMRAGERISVAKTELIRGQQLSKLFGSEIERPLYFTAGNLQATDTRGYLTARYEFNPNISGFINGLREGSLILLSIGGDEGAGLDAREMESLREMGVIPHSAVEADHGCAAVLVKRGGEYAGIRRFGRGESRITLEAGEEIACGVKSPFECKVVGGVPEAGYSTIKVNGKRCASGTRKIMVAVFEAASGIAIEPRNLYSRRTTRTLFPVILYRLWPFQPALRHPVERAEELTEYFNANKGCMTFDLKAMKRGRALTVFLFFVTSEGEAPGVRTQVVRSDGEDSESVGRALTEVVQIVSAESVAGLVPGLSLEPGESLSVWQISEEERMQHVTLQMQGRCRRVVGYMSFNDVLSHR